MSLKVSRIVSALEPSATMAMAAKAKALKAAGKTVYDFSLGEPDFTTPDHICQAATAAMQDGHTHYTAGAGIPELRSAVARQYEKVHGLAYKPSQVVVSNGAKHALNNVFTATIDPGDEVIIPAPYWVSYAEQVRLCGGRPVIVETSEASNFKLSPAQFRQALSNNSAMLLLCSPSNPTGTMYSREELGALADIAIEADLSILSDEIYERLIYGDHKFASFATVRPGLQERTILVNGVSKSYAMTGWRIGWTLAPEKISQAISDLQSQQTSNPSSISQYAALAAIEGPQVCVEEMLVEFAKRREFVAGRIKSLPHITCPEMAGAFYAFINIKEHLGRKYKGIQVNNSTEWCQTLLEQESVATVMGSSFGADGYARISFATSMAILEAGFDAIERFLKSPK